MWCHFRAVWYSLPMVHVRYQEFYDMDHATTLYLVPKARTYVLSSPHIATKLEGVSHAHHCVFEKASARFTYLQSRTTHSRS